MATFQFPLDPVLQQRRMTEDHSQRELAKVLRQRMIFQDQITATHRTIAEAKKDLAGDLMGTVNLDQVSRFAHYSGQMNHRLGQLVARLGELEKQVQQFRTKLLSATRDRQALDLLRERQWQRWRRDQARREAAELDDLVAGQFVRQQFAQRH